MEDSSDFMLKQTPLSRMSEEFGRVSYALQLSLGSASPDIKNVWSIGNPHLTMQFEKHSAELLTVDSWSNVALLPEGNTIGEISQKGFKIGPSGLKQPTGTILPEDLSTPQGSGKRTYEFIFSKTAVGRSYCLEAADFSAGRPVHIPPGYNSLYIHVGDEAQEAHAAASRNSLIPYLPGYHHDYVLTDPAQILPMYLVQFEYDPEEDRARKIPICDICEEAQAILYCVQDEAQLCAECDAEAHSNNKLFARHKRIDISEKTQEYGCCPAHQSKTVEFYCPICTVPVCVHCKMIGSHSSGEAANHKLVPLGEAYRGALSQANKEDLTLEKKRTAIINQLSAIEERLQEVNNNSKEIENLIYSMLQQALLHLEQVTHRKLGILLGDELELRRQLEEIEWSESFLRYQQQVQNPVEFLLSWNRHNKVRDHLHSFEHLRQTIDVAADVLVKGKIRVNTAAAFRDTSDEDGDMDDLHVAPPSDGDFVPNGAVYSRSASSRFRASLFRSQAAAAAFSAPPRPSGDSDMDDSASDGGLTSRSRGRLATRVPAPTPGSSAGDQLLSSVLQTFRDNGSVAPSVNSGFSTPSKVAPAGGDMPSESPFVRQTDEVWTETLRKSRMARNGGASSAPNLAREV